VIFGWGQPSGQPFGAYDVTTGTPYVGSLRWANVMGGTPSDGNWHCAEIHVKADTNGSNGVLQAWIDGVQTLNVTNANLNGETWEQATIPTNQSSVANVRDMALDVDDLKIGQFQRIGC
jgi:hypothetical protein